MVFVVVPKKTATSSDDQSLFSNIVSVDVIAQDGDKITQFADTPVELAIYAKKVNTHFLNLYW